MNHLTDDQLGARLDGIEPAAGAAAAAEHLAACAECRERLAALSELDASLAAALSHDPGEAYFASFADRVSERIAAGAPAAAATPARVGWLAWLDSPHRLAWAGAAAGVLAVSALAWVLARDGGADRFASQLAPESEVGASAPAAPLADAEPAAPVTEAASPGAQSLRATAPPDARDAERSNSAPPAGPAPLAAGERRSPAGRMQELRTLPNGEQVPVARRDLPVRVPAPAVTAPAPAGEAARVVKPLAQPMAAQSAPAVERPSAGAQRVVEQSEVAAPAPAPPAAPKPASAASRNPKFDTGGFMQKARNLLPPAPGAARPAQDNLTPPSSQPLAVPDAPLTREAVRGGRAAETPHAVGGSRMCGEVNDVQGRPIAGAVVTVTGTGASTSTNARGAFCLELPAARASVSVMAVGFLAYRAEAGAADAAKPLVITLQTVQALGQPAFPTRLKQPGLLGGATPLDDAVRQAREAVRAATRDHSAIAWDRAGAAWERAATLATDEAVANDVRRELAAARMNAWRAEATDARVSAAAAAVEAWLAKAPAGPLQDAARAWKAELSR